MDVARWTCWPPERWSAPPRRSGCSSRRCSRPAWRPGARGL